MGLELGIHTVRNHRGSLRRATKLALSDRKKACKIISGFIFAWVRVASHVTYISSGFRFRNFLKGTVGTGPFRAEGLRRETKCRKPLGLLLVKCRLAARIDFFHSHFFPHAGIGYG